MHVLRPSGLAGVGHALVSNVRRARATSTDVPVPMYPRCGSPLHVPCRSQLQRQDQHHLAQIHSNLQFWLQQRSSVAAAPLGAAARPAATASNPAEQLEGADLEAWTGSRALLEALGFSQEDSEILLSKAFGWRDRFYWRDEMVDRVPAVSDVSAVLDFLRECGLTADPDLQRLLREFPQVLACDLEGRLRPNVRKLDATWRISGPSLKGVLLRNPLLLGYTVDCGGDCISECDYCWARF